MSIRTVRPAATPPITLDHEGRIHHAPDSAIIAPATLAAWSRLGLAVAYCAAPTTEPTCQPTQCVGHQIAAGGPRAGHHLVIGRPPHRAVYLVNAAGSAGARVTRRA